MASASQQSPFLGLTEGFMEQIAGGEQESVVGGDEGCCGARGASSPFWHAQRSGRRTDMLMG